MSIRSTTPEERRESLGEPAGVGCPGTCEGELYRIPGIEEDIEAVQFACPVCTEGTYLLPDGDDWRLPEPGEITL